MIERALALLLLNAFWEPIAIAACAYAVLRIARSANAATRCAVLTAAIAGALLLPVITTAAVDRGGAPAPAPSARAAWHAQTAITVPAPAVSVMQRPHEPVPPAATNVRRPVISVPRALVLGVVGAWAAVAFLLLMRLVVSLVHLSRLRRDALPLSPDLRAQLRRWNEKAAGIDVRLCLSDETAVPVAVGLFDSMVLIPRRLLEELEPADLDRIVLHEIAHLRRRDGLIYAIQQIASALYFFSPGVVWLSKTLDIEREVACDDWVLERAADAAPYANCLVRLAEGVPWPHKALAAPGAFVTRHSMSIRIERILQHARDARLQAAPGPVFAALAAAGLVAAVGLSFAPSLAYTVMPASAKRAVRTHIAAKPITRAVHAAATPLVKTVPLPVAANTAVPKARNQTVKHIAVKSVVPAAPPSLTIAANPVPTASADPSGDYISEMRSLFGNSLSVDDLVALKSLRITTQYVQQLRAAGFEGTVHQVIAARSVGLTPQSIAAYRKTFGSASPEDLVALASLHVDAAYRDQLQAAGLTNLSAQQVMSLKSLGVTADYVRQADSFGFGALSAEQIIELRSMRIDRDFLQRVREHGFKNLTLEQVIELRSSGVIK